jgi:predicted phage baseplate assembly protein
MIPPIHSVIRATYRVGGGVEGNVSIGSVTTLVEPVLYGVSVNNATSATGGQNVESIDSIRINAARAFRARDRAVTIADFEAVAANAPGVSKAKAVGNNGSSVTVYVAPTADSTITRNLDGTVHSSITAAQRTEIRSYLEQRAMAGVTVSVFGPQWLQVYMKITAHCRPTASQQQVVETIKDTMSSFYGFTNVDFDGRVAVADISNALAGIDGLDYIEVDDLSLDSRIMAPNYSGTPVTDTIILNEHATGAIQYFSEPYNLSVTAVGGIGVVG